MKPVKRHFPLQPGCCVCAAEYCCAGPGRCPIAVPRPPSFDNLPRPPRTARSGSLSEIPSTRAVGFITDMQQTVTVRNEDEVSASGLVTPVNLCPNAPRSPADPNAPLARAQAKIISIYSFTWPPPNAQPACSNFFNPYRQNRGCSDSGCVNTGGACSGNTISSGLVLLAAHCVDPKTFR